MTSPQTWTYAYDADGNRTSETGNSTGSHTFGYNTDDELTLQDSSAKGWSYDANGNETAGIGASTRTAETYSPTDQLTGLTAGGTPSSFTYTGLGNGGRTNTTVNSTATNYQSGQEGLANQTTGTTTLAWTRDPSGTLIAERNGTDHEYYLYDGQGSVLALVNTAGTINATYTYDPYGITTTSGTLATTNPYRYTGGYQDAGGLYHFGARYYDPTLGRFTQRDPSGQDSGYSYAGENPVDEGDSSGLSSGSVEGPNGTFSIDLVQVSPRLATLELTINGDYDIYDATFSFTLHIQDEPDQHISQSFTYAGRTSVTEFIDIASPPDRTISVSNVQAHAEGLQDVLLPQYSDSVLPLGAIADYP